MYKQDKEHYPSHLQLSNQFESVWFPQHWFLLKNILPLPQISILEYYFYSHKCLGILCPMLKHNYHCNNIKFFSHFH